MRIAIGANTAVITADAISTHSTSAATTPPCISPRDAIARYVTGFSATTACSQPGMVAGSTKMSLTKVSGNNSRKLVVITDSGVRTIKPKMIQIHDTADANTSI